MIIFLVDDYGLVIIRCKITANVSTDCLQTLQGVNGRIVMVLHM